MSSRRIHQHTSLLAVILRLADSAGIFAGLYLAAAFVGATVGHCGITAAVTRLAALLHTNNFTLGGGTFDATRPMLHFPAELWDARLLGVRLLSALLALLPLLPAIALFHRFDPQKVRRLVGARASKLQALTN